LNSKSPTRAASEASDGNRYAAVTLYVIWAEHFINGLLGLQFARLGYDQGIIKPLLRELKLITKASALWQTAKLPLLPEEHLKSLDRAIELRNYFVHYKWTTVRPEDYGHEKARLTESVSRMEEVVTFLTELETRELWCGRENEITACLRASIEEHEREFGLPDFLTDLGASSDQPPRPE
jgi:hypothetical protein